MKTEDFILLSEMVIAQLSSGSESAWSDEIEFVLFSRVFPLNFRLQFIPLHFLTVLRYHFLFGCVSRREKMSLLAGSRLQTHSSERGGG